MFESELDGETFHTYLNTKHKNIKFRFEKKVENKLPFLDFLIGNDENLQTSDFYKKTFTGLLLNYFRFVPNSYENGLIKELIDRKYRIDSTWQNKIQKFCKRVFKNAKVKLVFTSDKLRQTFTYKDSYPSFLKGC